MNIFQRYGVTAKILLIHFADKYRRGDSEILAREVEISPDMSDYRKLAFGTQWRRFPSTDNPV